jgi:hypothetical protein
LYSDNNNEVFILTLLVMSLHYVIFDGSSAYVTDEQDMLSITSKDRDAEVVFKSMNLDKASDFADEYNDSL